MRIDRFVARELVTHASKDGRDRTDLDHFDSGVIAIIFNHLFVPRRTRILRYRSDNVNDLPFGQGFWKHLLIVIRLKATTLMILSYSFTISFQNLHIQLLGFYITPTSSPIEHDEKLLQSLFWIFNGSTEIILLLFSFADPNSSSC